MARIEGVGPDQPLTIDGKQSDTPYRFDLLQPLALARVAALAKVGHEKYNIPCTNYEPYEHLNHAMQHIFAHIAGDDQEGHIDEHAVHAAWRILAWLECLEYRKQVPNE